MQMAIFTTESDGAKAGGYARMSFQTREALGILISDSKKYISNRYTINMKVNAFIAVYPV